MTEILFITDESRANNSTSPTANNSRSSSLGLIKPESAQFHGDGIIGAEIYVCSRNSSMCLEDLSVKSFKTTGSPLASNRKKETIGSPLKNAFLPATVTVSAALYLVDFISTCLVLQIYWDQVYIKGTFDGSSPGRLGRDLSAFVTCLTLVVVSQIVALLVFKLNLPSEEHPCRSAHLLPFMQVYRMLKGIWRSRGCTGGRGSQRWESHRAESLFAIMSALETSVQLPLQLSYITLVGALEPKWKPSRIMVISIVASFLSGAYNAGLAIMYNLSIQWGFMLNASGIAGGLYTMGSLLLRSTSMISISAASIVSEIDHVLMYGIYFAFVIPIWYVFGLISLGKPTRMCSIGSQVRAWIVTSFYVLGPVYPVLEGFAQKIPTREVQVDTLARLLVVIFLNLFIDVLTFCVLANLGWGICNYSKGKVPHPELPNLSSTFTCSIFVTVTSVGAVLSVISTIGLCYVLNRCTCSIKPPSISRSPTITMSTTGVTHMDTYMRDHEEVARNDIEGYLTVKTKNQGEFQNLSVRFIEFSSCTGNTEDKDLHNMRVGSTKCSDATVFLGASIPIEELSSDCEGTTSLNEESVSVEN